MANQIFAVAPTALLLWSLGFSVPIMVWNARRLRRDVHGWLRRRGVDCPDEVRPHVFWLEGGGVGLGGRDGRFEYFRRPFTAAVITPSAIVLESQWPLLLWRRRLVIPQGAVMRIIGDRVADPKRRCLVGSSPPGHLVTVLQISGWELKEVPF